MPAATRLGDADVAHCAGMVRAQASPNVYVNNIRWSRQTDLNTSHDGPACVAHSAPIETGSISVFVNGLGAGRVGDRIKGCTLVAEGSPDVFAGD